MSKSEYIWFLHCQKIDLTLKSLSMEEISWIISQIPQADRESWFVWQKDWKTWIVLDHLKDEFKVKRARPIIKSVPSIENDCSKISSLISTVQEKYDSEEKELNDIRLDFETGENRVFVERAAKRYDIQLSLIIEGINEKFETKSLDISLGGVRLKDSLPEWIFGYCTVHFMPRLSKYSSWSATCYIVEGQQPGSRFRVALLPFKNRDKEEEFITWLINQKISKAS